MVILVERQLYRKGWPISQNVTTHNEMKLWLKYTLELDLKQKSRIASKFGDVKEQFYKQTWIFVCQ